MGRYWVHSAPEDMGADDDGQRPCARGERCAEATTVREGGKTVRQPALGPRAFCQTDRGQIVRSLEQFPAYHAQLCESIGDKGVGADPSGYGTGPASGTRWAPPIPINTGVDTIRGDLVKLVAAWCERVDAVAQLSGDAVAATRRGDAPAWAVEAMCGTLVAHVDVLLALPAEPMTEFLTADKAAELGDDEATVTAHTTDGYLGTIRDRDGADAGTAILRLNARCRHFLGLVGHDEEVHTACWECELRGMLVRPDGAAGLLDMARCRNCGTIYEGDRFALLMTHAEQDRTRKREQREAS